MLYAGLLRCGPCFGVSDGPKERIGKRPSHPNSSNHKDIKTKAGQEENKIVSIMLQVYLGCYEGSEVSFRDTYGLASK